MMPLTVFCSRLVINEHPQGLKLPSWRLSPFRPPRPFLVAVRLPRQSVYQTVHVDAARPLPASSALDHSAVWCDAKCCNHHRRPLFIEGTVARAWSLDVCSTSNDPSMAVFDAPCRNGLPPRRYRFGLPYQSLLYRFARQHEPLFRLRAPDSDRSYSRAPKLALRSSEVGRHWRPAMRYTARPSFRHAFATLGSGTRLLAYPLPRVSPFLRAGLTQR
jgi:hypothetical protein